MNGRRCKSLRAEFFAQHGRKPRPADREGTEVAQRRIAPDYVAREHQTKVQRLLGIFGKKSEAVQQYFRGVFAVRIIAPSEWRRLKKDYKRGRHNAAPQFVSESGRAAWRIRKTLMA